MSFASKAVWGIVGAIGAGGAGIVYSLEKTIAATDLHLHPTCYPWSHQGYLKLLDHASLRRGYHVYKNVCSACHGLKYVPYRRMIGVCLTESEAKADAAEAMYEDGPNEEGKMFMRPGKIADKIKSPYENDTLAKIANNGALPPDLSLITLARKGSEDYIFSLLTGYCDAPAGVTLNEGTHYNPYFLGGVISMAPPLYNEILEFDDGTPASLSQCAKDVSTFLVWAAVPHYDERQRIILKTVTVLFVMLLGTHYVKRVKWNSLKNRKFSFLPVPPKVKRPIK